MRPIATRDANDATWYVLQAASDFAPRTDPTLDPWVSPSLDPSLFYDAGRHVLELRPVKPAVEAEPLPGLATDANGVAYRVDPETGRVLVRCGTSERELVRERGALVSAAGLAFDRRDLLYIADPPAHRILVVVPDDGSVAGVVAGGLEEPVDVAVGANGRVYVADRRAGKIVVFNSRFDRCGEFAPQDPAEPTVAPRPIAVIVAGDGAVLVADANYPRLLRFTPDGELLGDVEIRTAAAEERDESLSRLSLRHAFSPGGTFVSAALDGGTPGVAWHKIEIDADLPEGTWLKIQTATADNPSALGHPLAIPTIGEHDDVLALTHPAFVPFEDASVTVKPILPSDVPDRLVFSPPGRWLRVRLTLGSDGSATPSVRAIRLFYSRVSYLDLLPRVYRRDPVSASFLEHFLALFERVFTGVENRFELFTRELNPDAAPLDVLNWLACLIDLSFDPSWPIGRRRALVAAAMELYATRGTPGGLARFVEIYTGQRPVILESFLERPRQPPFLGLPGMFLGSTTHLAPPLKTQTPDELFLSRWVHRFTVLVFLEERCDEAVTLAVVDRIVNVNKPAHTVHALRPVRPGAAVGRSRVGVDVMLGAREAPATTLGGCIAAGVPGDTGSILGADSILGEERRVHARQTALAI